MSTRAMRTLCFNAITAPRFFSVAIESSSHGFVQKRHRLQTRLFASPSLRQRCHLVNATVQANAQCAELLQPISETLHLTDVQTNLLSRLTGLVISANQSFNLTGIKTAEDITVKHIIDALTLLPTLDQQKPRRIIDVGTGAGFPGFVLAIARPDVHVTLLDSARKKTAFHQHAIAELSLSNVNTVWARAEEAGRDEQHRECYCFAVARSVAEMKVLSELCLPLVRVGGTFIAQKVIDSEQSEINSAKSAIGQLGGRLQSVETAWPSSFGEGGTIVNKEGHIREKALVVISKEKSTPPQFPRRPGVPNKSPLR